jgi:hypothetical protein
MISSAFAQVEGQSGRVPASDFRAVFSRKIAKLRSEGRFPSVAERAAARRAAANALATPTAPITEEELAPLLSSLDDAIPADDEEHAAPATAPVSANDNARTFDIDEPEDDEPAPTLVRGLVTSPSRRRQRVSDLRQSEDARSMRARGQPLPGEVVEDLSHPTPTQAEKPKGETHAQRKPKGGRPKTSRARSIASWEDAGEKPRIIAINRALAEFGTPFAFSLNLDPDLIRAANDNARGFLDHVRRKVVRTLKRALGRVFPIWLVVETDNDGRPHLHGGIALNDNDRPDEVEKTLAKSGGDWTRPGSAPADVRRQWCPDGWACYPLKRLERTRRHLREAAGLDPDARVTLYSVTDDLREAGQRIHDDERRAIGRR